MFKCLRESNNCIIKLYQQTNNVHYMYLTLENLKVTSKTGQQLSQNLKARTELCVSTLKCKKIQRNKLLKIGNITYLVANKIETRCSLTYLHISQ